MNTGWTVAALCASLAIFNRMGLKSGWLGSKFQGYEFFVVLALALVTAYLGERIFTFYLYFRVTRKNPDRSDYKKPLYKDETPIPEEIRAEVLARDGRRCAYHFHLGNLTEWHIDHSTPRDYDGENSYENLVVSCPACNLRKSGKIEFEFLDPVLRRLWKRGKTVHRELVQMPDLTKLDLIALGAVAVFILWSLK